MSIPLPAYTPTGEFPNPIIPIGGNAWLNRASYNLITLLSIPYMGMINTWRRELLCLPPRPRFKNELVRDDNTRTTVLYPFSEHVVPRPADWDASAHITGYWFLEQTWQPPADLVRFLEAGDAPVYVGFGSMVGTDAEEKGRIVLEALRRSGQRGVIASGWGGLKLQNVPDNVFLLKEAPHDWLFPRMAAVVHHGGAGTTAAGLRAGVPTVICPFMGDQPFWGRRVESLGVGVAPIPQKKLNADNLTEAIQRVVQSTEIRRNAAELGARIRAEDGVGNAVSIISRILSGSQSREPMLAAL
jgi:sterol 3beta-glucosyltransferase